MPPLLAADQSQFLGRHWQSRVLSERREVTAAKLIHWKNLSMYWLKWAINLTCGHNCQWTQFDWCQVYCLQLLVTYFSQGGLHFRTSFGTMATTWRSGTRWWTWRWWKRCSPRLWPKICDLANEGLDGFDNCECDWLKANLCQSLLSHLLLARGQLRQHCLYNLVHPCQPEPEPGSAGPPQKKASCLKPID